MSAKLLAVTVIVFLALAFGMFLFIDSFDTNLNEATGLTVSSESFPTYLETHPAVSTLPKSASIGIKIGETAYEIEGQDVGHAQELSGKDIVVSLPQGYETVIGELGVCDAIKKAYNDGQVSVETYASKTVLFMKYRKLLKYGECLK